MKKHKQQTPAKAPRIVLGVTADISLTLMRGMPRYLSDSGWDVHVVSSPGPLLEQMRATPGVTTHALTMERDPAPLKDIASLVRWIRLLHRIRPDVISVGTPKAGLLGCLAGWLTGVPRRVYHLRGLRLETATGLARKVFMAAEWITARASTDVLSVSHSLRDRFVNLGLVRADKVTVVGSGSSNGVLVQDFDSGKFSVHEVGELRESLAIQSGVPVIGFVGRLTEDKGLKVLAEARRILVEEGIDHQLLVVGAFDGDKGIGNLESINEFGRAAITTGYIASPAIYYQLMDVFCLPTYREGYPNVVLEASASALPTVTTDATGAVDSVIHETTGLIARTGDAVSLAHALRTVLGDRERADIMGQNALDRVSNHYSRQHVQNLIMDYYAPRRRIKAGQ